MKPIITLIVFLALSFFGRFKACGEGIGSAERKGWTAAMEDQALQQLAGSDLPMTIERDPEIIRTIRRYLVEGRRETEAMLDRSAQYFPVFENYLENYGLPEFLKIIPIVESRLQPEALSPVGAAGIWQFMPETARHYGLRVEEQGDERFDLLKSTRAAMRVLRELHTQFEDWGLVLAAYNCGEGRVRRAIRKTKSRDWERIKPLLPRQTQRYLTEFAAVAHIIRGYEKKGEMVRLEDLFRKDIRVSKPEKKEYWSAFLAAGLLQDQNSDPMEALERNRAYWPDDTTHYHASGHSLLIPMHVSFKKLLFLRPRNSIFGNG